MVKPGLSRRLLESHLVIAFSGMVFVCVMFASSLVMRNSANTLAEIDSPASVAIMALLNSVQSSVYANRSWIFMHKAEYHTLRQDYWTPIHESLEKLRKSLNYSDHIINEAQFIDLSLELSQLEKSLSWSEHLSQELNNKQAKMLYLNQVDPLIEQIKHSLTSLISVANEAPHTPTTVLQVNALRGFQQHFLYSQLELERLLLNGEIRSHKAFNSVIKLAGSEMNILHESTNKEDVLYSQVQYIKEKFSTYNRIVKAVAKENSSASWNQAHKYLKVVVIPTADRIINRLQQLEVAAAAEVARQHEKVKAISTYTLYCSIIAFLGLLISAVIISRTNSSRLVSRIQGLSVAVEGYSKNHKASELPERGDDEISGLVRLFNQMTLSLSQRENAYKIYQIDLEQRVLARTGELEQEKELAETTLRSIGDAVISTDANGRIMLMNPPAEALIVCQAEAVIGKSIYEVLRFQQDGEDLAEEDSPVAKSLKNNQKTVFESSLVLLRDSLPDLAIQITSAPISADGLVVDGSIVVIRDISKELALQSKLSYQANHDLLTGLANRAKFQRSLHSLLTSARENDRTHVLAYLDLDKFKIVNDTCGHAAGDELLRQIAYLLTNTIRQADTLARIGGDEFAILFYDCSVDRAVSICKNIRDEVGRFRFGWHGNSFKVGVSVGVVEINAQSQDLSQVLRHADAACYDAKGAGRNTVCVARKTLGETMDGEESGWVGRITRAIENDSFELVGQPIVSISGTESISTIEILVRMRGDNGELIVPNAFIPAADRHGLSSSIDRWVIETIFKRFRNHQMVDSDGHQLAVSVNLSAASLMDDEFLDFVGEQLNSPDIPSELIWFELNETVLVSNLSKVQQLMNQWVLSGCHFTLDEFGGGLAAINYLKYLPIDQIKIDGSLVRGLPDSPVNATVIAAINDLAHLTGRKTIATYVENDEVFEALKKIGVDYVQGWAIAHPSSLFDPPQKSAEKLKAVS